MIRSSITTVQENNDMWSTDDEVESSILHEDNVCLSESDASGFNVDLENKLTERFSKSEKNKDEKMR